MKSWQDSIQKTIHASKAQLFHYKMPRGIGATSFLIGSAVNFKNLGSSVMFVEYNRSKAIPGINTYCVNDILNGHLAGKQFDWAMIDNLGYCVPEDIKRVLFHITLTGARIIWIDTVEGTDLDGETIKFELK